MITCCKVENCVGKGSVFWGYGAAVWGILKEHSACFSGQ